MKRMARDGMEQHWPAEQNTLNILRQSLKIGWAGCGMELKRMSEMEGQAWPAVR